MLTIGLACRSVTVICVLVLVAACNTCADELPGVVTAPSLTAQLATALDDKESTYRGCTEHLNVDGAPRYTNRLLLEHSPYLIQHAHNPVNWFPWGPEAFAQAKREDKPTFCRSVIRLVIGVT
jgi:hypothetical protein